MFGEMYAVLSLLVVLGHTQCGICGLVSPCYLDAVNNTISSLKWQQAAVIHDNDRTHPLHVLERMKLLVYEINNSTLLETVLYEVHARLFPEVNVIVCLEAGLITKVIHEVDGFDVKSNQSTDWSHHSKWLVFTTDSTLAETGCMKLENLQNVAITTVNSETCACSVNTFSMKHWINRTQSNPLDETVPVPLMMFPNMQYRYNRRTLRVSTVASGPCATASATGEEDDIPLKGFCIDVARIIAKHLNLTLQYTEASDHIWGWIDDGMIGQLKRKEIDLVADIISVHFARAQHVDFVTPFLLPGEVVIVYKMPPANNPILLLAQPFQAWVYITYIAVMFSVIATLLIIQKIGAQRRTVSHVCWDVIKSFWKQGYEHITDSGRFLLVAWWLLVIIISSLYCGNLTATLAAQSSLKKFHSIAEVINSDFVIGFWPGGILEQHFKNSTHADINGLYEKIIQENETDPTVTSTSFDFHMKQVNERRYMYVGFNVNVDIFIEKNCNLTGLLVDSLPQEPVTFAVQKDSPFKDDINKVMGELTSRGIIKRLWEKWNKQNRTGKCARDRNSITVTELIGGMVVAGVGVGLAVVSLVLETLIAKRRRNNLGDDE